MGFRGWSRVGEKPSHSVYEIGKIAYKRNEVGKSGRGKGTTDMPRSAPLTGHAPGCLAAVSCCSSPGATRRCRHCLIATTPIRTSPCSPL